MLTARAEIEKPRYRSLLSTVEQWWGAVHRNSVRDVEMSAAYLYGAGMAIEPHDKELKLFYELRFLRQIAEDRVIELRTEE
ncbi:MAG: hypothetical protein AB1560_01975 [Pseudomonadota bacterium]